MERLAAKIGRALRRARQGRGLTLKELAAASRGRFKATSVAGYERGERSITVERFCELCGFYDVAPEQLLSEIVRTEQAHEESVIDLTVLESLDPEQHALVSSFVRQIRALRGERARDTIVLRAGDLEVLATAAGREPEELLGMLRPPERDGS